MRAVCRWVKQLVHTVTLALEPRPCLVTSSHPCMCTWLFERSLPPVSHLLPQVLLPPLPDSCHGAWREFHGRSLCNSAVGSMVSLDYVTPDTGYEPKDMGLADTTEHNIAASSDIYFQDILEDTVSFSNPDIDDDELAKLLAIVVDRTEQPVEVRSNSDHFSCSVRNVKGAQSQFLLVTQSKRMIDQTGGPVEGSRRSVKTLMHRLDSVKWTAKNDCRWIWWEISSSRIPCSSSRTRSQNSTRGIIATTTGLSWSSSTRSCKNEGIAEIPQFYLRWVHPDESHWGSEDYHGPRLYVCSYVCQALPSSSTICVYMCVTKCVYMCVTKCVC